MRTLHYALVLPLLVIVIISCYKAVTLESSDQDVIYCHDNSRTIKGEFYIISDIDSLQGDELSIDNNTNEILYYNYWYSNNWEIQGHYLNVSKTRHETLLESDLNFLNGRAYVCKNVILIKGANNSSIKLYRK